MVYHTPPREVSRQDKRKTEKRSIRSYASITDNTETNYQPTHGN